MKYMGSKARHAKHILPIILENRKTDQWYVEPFVGGANTYHLVDNPKLGNDTNHYLIMLLQAVGKGWHPPLDVSEEQYKNAQSLSTTNYPDYLIGFIGIGCSFSGKWFGGYARGNNGWGYPRNYASESSKNIVKQANGIKDSILKVGDYYELDIPEKSIIYCDPPYMGTTKYSDYFDSNRFWEWCDNLIKKGHQVFVSEYQAPDGWTCVWQKEVNSSLTKNTGAKKAIEKLFTKGV